MKNTIKFITIMLLAILVLGGCSLDKCKDSNDPNCELEEIETLEIEADANIVIGVFNDAYGENLVASWDLEYPTYKDMLSYKLIENNSEDENLNFKELDLIQISREKVPLYFKELEVLDDSFNEYLKSESNQRFSGQLNYADNYFMPFDVEGVLFAYNKTMLEEFNVDLSDENNDGLPDAIDSFEKIGELAKLWRKENVTYLDQKISQIFSLPLNEQLSMLSFIDNSNYRLIKGSSGESLSLDEDLVVALESLSKLGKYKWNYDDSLSNENLVWNYEEVLEKQQAPFLLVGNWMYYDHFQTSKAYELVFAKLPQLNAVDLKTLSSVTGFVVSSQTKYPNAANRVLKHIKSANGTIVALESGVIPIIEDEILEGKEYTVDKNTLQQIKAYQYSEPAPLQAFEQKPEKRAWDIYLELDFTKIYKQVFLNEISPEKGAKQIKELIIEWLDNEKIIIEGVNDADMEADN